MLNRIRENKPEFILALIVLITFGSYSLFSLSRLYPQILSNQNFNNSEINSENKSFYIKNKQNKCLGSLQSSIISEDQNVEYLMKTSLKVSADGKPGTLQINVQAAFNPLKQMVASVISAQGLDSEIIIGILNVNPVELSVSYNKNKQSLIKKKIGFPGPFVLKKIINQFYIEHQPTAKSIPLDSSSTILALLNLELAPASPETANCPEQFSDSLDLSLLSRQLESRLQSVTPDLGAEIAAVAGILKMPTQ